MRLGFIIGILLFVHSLCWGQHFYSKNYTVNDGLPSNSVRCIYKDTKERMWIGTGAGLCQFDGKSFKVLSSNNGLVGEKVYSITEDDQQNLWFGCMNGGISKYDGNTFINYTTKEGLVSDNVRVVWYSRKFHLLFIGTNDGCSVFDGKAFVSLSAYDIKTPDLYVMGFLEGDDYVCIYPYDHKQYYKFYPQSRKFILANDSYYLSHNTSTSPLIRPSGDTIIGSLRDGINILHNGINKSFKGMGQVFDFKPDQDANVWIACWSENALSKVMPGGLFKYDGKEVIQYSEKVGITDPTVWGLYYDTTFQVLWVGTLNLGMYKIPLPIFEWFDKKDVGLNELNIYSLLATKDNSLVIGTKGELLYRNENGVIKALQTNALKKLASSDPHEFNCIKQDRTGNIYASTYQSKLIKYSPSDNFTHPQIIWIGGGGATQFAFDTHDSVYYSDKWWDGTYHCSIFPKLTEPIYWGFKENNGPPNVIKMISCGDTIWYISQTEGLFRSLKGRIDYFRKQDPLLPRIINDICFDGNGNIIVGSNTGGVIIARYENNKLKIKHRLQSGKEIIGNTVNFLVVDNIHNLFVGTNLGLNRINLNALYSENQIISNFYDGEVGYYDHSGKVAERDEQGNIWVGTDSHLLKIDTKLLDRLAKTTPRIQITLLDVNYQPDSSIDLRVPKKFSHGNNNLIFHFVGTNYLNPDQTLYRYKLEGLSNNWSEYSTETKAVFTSLNPGNYHLVIEAYNRLDNAKKGSTEFIFQISYPWYLQGWFIIGSVLLLILFVFVIIRSRTEKIKKEEQKKSEFNRQLATIEMRALQSQMNPHFIFNSINSIQGFILKNKIDEARGYLMDFAKILRQTLDNATKELIMLEEELQYIQYYLNLELMRFDQKFKVDIRVPDNINPKFIQIPPMIIQPYVENSIRHGLLHKTDEQGLLSIEFSIVGKDLKCVIEDNGVGRKRSKEIESWKQLTHKPQSTRITQDRIDLLNKSTQVGKYRVTIFDLYDEHGEGSGTSVEIILPLMSL